jgi:long-chain acyl-CoA synthetase
VWPVEIENAIRENNYVEDAIVVPRKDEYKGEVPVAYVKLRAGVLKSDEIKKSIYDICRQKLAKFKIPSDIIFIDKIPLNASGKIKRSDIYKIIGENL